MGTAPSTLMCSGKRPCPFTTKKVCLRGRARLLCHCEDCMSVGHAEQSSHVLRSGGGNVPEPGTAHRRQCGVSMTTTDMTVEPRTRRHRQRCLTSPISVRALGSHFGNLSCTSRRTPRARKTRAPRRCGLRSPARQAATRKGGEESRGPRCACQPETAAGDEWSSLCEPLPGSRKDRRRSAASARARRLRRVRWCPVIRPETRIAARGMRLCVRRVSHRGQRWHVHAG